MLCCNCFAKGLLLCCNCFAMVLLLLLLYFVNAYLVNVNFV